ncbi:hypothetical protein GCM10027422_36330 [Hymenobacter arcticus]
MGELSRTIGELGENITLENILKKIGWRGQPNFDIKCVSKNKHSKGQHGIDFFAPYIDPLISDTFATILVSVKYNEAVASNAKFAEYAEDIATASECLKFTSEYNNAKKSHQASKTKSSCVLFWLNHTSHDERNILNKVGDISTELKSRFDTIYLVDNFRLSFLYKSIIFAENLYPNSLFEFVYPPTGLNDRIDGARELAGKLLPVEFINSPVLPFRLILKDNQKILLLCLNEPFDDNALRRMMGLAEGLTGGWCNKVVLTFPDYQPSQHERIKNSVCLDFTRSFSEMIEVMSYNNSFKNLERNNSANFYENSSQNEANKNINTMLPFGDRIRQLLVQSYIYKQDLQVLLNKRGVFIEKQATKAELVPLLSKMLISPTEFDYLRRKQVAKENAEKISYRHLIVDEKFSNSDLLPILESALGESVIREIILKDHPNCHLSGSPTFELDQTGDIQINFQITRNNLSKDWATGSTTFDGQVVIKSTQQKSDAYQCRVDMISTSSETKNISKQIIEQFIKKIKELGMLPKEAEVKKLLANSLVNRSNFLFKFISELEKLSKVVFFKELLSFETKIANHSEESISADVESLKNKVNNSFFSGHALESISYISNPKYRQIFNCYLMTCIFKVNSSVFEGEIQVEFGFPDLKSKSEEKSEFELKILEINPSDFSVLTARDYHEIEIYLRDEFNSMKDTAYQTAEKKPNQMLLPYA